MKPKFYLTTPLYYVNDIPHIGHSYTTIAADVLARYKRMAGYDVYFLTGTDEHGQKMSHAAAEQGKKPQEFVDKMVKYFKNAWKVLEITHDDFIRTTEARHQKVVQEIFKKLYEQGNIYKGEYEGWYCTPCESFWTETQLSEEFKEKGLKHWVCPDCGRPVEKIKEETYYFRQSKYQDKLLKHIEDHPEFIVPQSRRNEVLSFVRQGLRDISVSRTAFEWGVKVPIDPKHVVYVWFDALINYVSALGYLIDEEKFNRYWPADVHIMGKEIVRFHTVTWPIMLMALGIPLPKKIFGHGWWTVEGEKMSKSKANMVDPLELSKEFGVDPVRYFVLREVPFGLDGDFSKTGLIQRFNADLANDFGNLLNRSLTMVEKYFEGKVPALVEGAMDDLGRELVTLASLTVKEVDSAMDKLAFSEALIAIWKLVNKANYYIEKEAPWTLSKEGKQNELATMMYNLMEVLRIVAILITPFMPGTGEKIWQQLGIKESLSTQTTGDLGFGKFRAGTKVYKGKPLFPRIVK